jgi:putative ABC transport system permease protein
VVPRFDHPALPASWRNAQIWVPLTWDSHATTFDHAQLSVVARTPEGMDPAAAAARLETEAQRVSNGASNGDRLVRVRPMDLSFSPATRAMVLTAMGAAVFVLLIACANVANLLLIKAVARQREVATRMALGASRARIARQLFLESAVLGVAGVPGGLLLGRLGRDWLLAGSLDQPSITVPIDATVVAVSIGTALLTALVFGFAPAITLVRGSIPQVLADGARQATGGRSYNRLRLAFATGAVALSVVLSASASLLARSFGNLVAADRTIDLSPFSWRASGRRWIEAKALRRPLASPGTSSIDFARFPVSRL